MTRAADSSSTTLAGFTHVYRPGTEGAPVLLLLHGTGGDEHDLLPLGPMLAPDAALLSPRGQVLERGMPRFFRRLAEGVFDLDDLRQRTHALADFVGAAAAHYHFDAKRVVAVGFSNGANIAASVLLLRPGVLAGAILFSPMPPLDPDPAPDLTGTQVFIGAGRLDAVARPEQAERLAGMLRAAHADVTIHWTHGGHGIDGGEIDAARAWLARFAVGGGGRA